MKILRGIGMLSIGISFITILGTAGSADLGIISSEQTTLQLLVALAVGIIGLIFMIYEPKQKPQPIKAMTPEQTYHKCCYCPHYATCTKTLEEVIKC